MANLDTEFAGIRSPNPFWLASAPPTNTGDQVMRAFDAGWGGAVWKTLGDPIVNVYSRYGGTHQAPRRLIGLNNIELITDRPLEVNFREIAQVKKRYPDNAVIVSLMVESREEWREMVRRSEDAGADGLELNFGCPHGMCERGMGSAVGQEPRVAREITSWVRDLTGIPVIVKLTPQVTDIRDPARAAQAGGADGLSLINTIKSIVGVDLDRFTPYPAVGGRSTHGGYCGPAVKPIALQLVATLARDPELRLPISGIGGIGNWRDAVEFILLGATSVQVCQAVMHYGFRIVGEMIEGLSDYMDEKGFENVSEMVGRAVPNYVEWGDLDLNYRVKARIHEEKCIGCQLCYVACYDGSHQAIALEESTRIPKVVEDDCIGCNLCHLICPVPGAVTMEEVESGLAPQSWKERTAAQQ